MNIPKEEIQKILIFHRQHGRNFVLYVLGIQEEKGTAEELSSNFYNDLRTLQTEAGSIVRFIQSLGFKLEHQKQTENNTLTFLKNIEH